MWGRHYEAARMVAWRAVFRLIGWALILMFLSFGARAADNDIVTVLYCIAWVSIIGFLFVKYIQAEIAAWKASELDLEEARERVLQR